MTVRVVHLADRAEVPWKNGGGVTRELERSPAEGDFDWRLSVADVAADGPFSEFTGVDRILVLLRGDGMTLTFTDDGSTVSLSAPLDRIAFAGERPVHATLRGAPTLDLNLMWRRSSRRVACEVMPCVDVRHDVPAAGVVLLVVGAGSAVLPSGEVLAVGDTVVVEDDAVPALRGDASVVRFMVS